MYHVVFHVVKNRLTKCVEYETKFNDLRFDFRFVTRSLRFEDKVGFEIWLNDFNIFTE